MKWIIILISLLICYSTLALPKQSTENESKDFSIENSFSTSKETKHLLGDHQFIFLESNDEALEEFQLFDSRGVKGTKK